MQSRPDQACGSDSDPVYMIRSRYGNLIRFRSGAPIYTGCTNQIILRSGNSIVFRSGTTISFRPGLKLAKVQPDLNPIKTRGSMQSRDGNSAAHAAARCCWCTAPRSVATKICITSQHQRSAAYKNFFTFFYNYCW